MLHYSPAALCDLDEIWTYIADDLQNPAAAHDVVNGILDTVEKLREFPEMGPLLSSVTEIESDYPFLVCGKYLTFYRIMGADLRVDRVLYGRRDYLRILFGSLPEGTTSTGG